MGGTHCEHSQHRFGDIMEVIVIDHHKEDQHREMLKGHICPFNREKAESGARVPLWMSLTYNGMEI